MSTSEIQAAAVRKMVAAALEFCSMHVGQPMALFLPPKDAVLLFPLSTPVALALLARDELARTFIARLSEAARGEGGGNVVQLCYVVRALQIAHQEWTAAELEEFARHAEVKTMVRDQSGRIRGPDGVQ
jgi:hypothetical protein